ncbi:SDR family NAD(P)-dependent oxidoreductase [Alkalicoccus halolimnae]|uniref:SDR family oxidoreductase n=1 Tax=Alkalicoccus halolimnae TaxID=1667239 RepID=A0A5C7FDS5_9BACI|nr:SDR family oxidoreductase [Alkalicoccus halolimnae]TXF83077.1 SDR family oxidoreductase [Alkalicoccus halolimnae]
MQTPLLNKVVVITGASSGIGAEMALETARKGGLPVLIARSEDKLVKTAEKIIKETNTVPYIYPADVTDYIQMKKLIGELEEITGSIDVLINNAGVGVFDYITDIDMEEADTMFRVNVLGTMVCTKAVLPGMKKRAAGQIIFMSSIAGSIATPKAGVYAATKHAVNGFADACRLETKGFGIDINVVSPGPVETGFIDHADKEGTYKQSVASVILEAEEVARKTIRLVSRPKRQLILPAWMRIPIKIQKLSPGFFEWMAGSTLRKK